MAVATSTALIATAVIGAGSAYYQGEKQEEIAEEQQQRVDAQRRAEQERQKQIARDTKPEELGAKGVKLGGDSPLGDAYAEFLTPKTDKSSTLGTSGTSGLGFAV